MKLIWKVGRTAADPEKAVLPTIIYIGATHQSFYGDVASGFMIAAGWWDFSVKVGAMWMKPRRGDLIGKERKNG